MNKYTASILTVLVLFGCIVGLWWLFFGMPPDLQLDQFVFDKTEIVVGLITAIIAPIVGLLIFSFITKSIENPVMRFLNGLWLPSDKPMENVTEEDLGKSWYKTQPGERHELTVVSNWWATTFLKLATPGVVLMTVGMALGVVQFSILDSSLLIRALTSLGISVICLLLLEPSYLYVEWFRRNTLIIVFTYTIFYLKAYDGGIFGLLTGLVNDVQRRKTPIGLIREPEITTDPRRITFRGTDFHDLRNTFFDILGSQKPRGMIGRLLWRLFKPLATGVRTLFLPSFFKDASDTFLSISFGEMFLNILEIFQGQTLSSKRDLERVSDAAADIRLRLRDHKDLDKTDAAERAQTFISERIGDMSVPQLVNLWGCRQDPGLWDIRTGKPTGTNSSSGPAMRSARQHFDPVIVAAPRSDLGTLDTRSDADFVPPLQSE
jgi:hypothetical protein